jgi:hypothetical protein
MMLGEESPPLYCSLAVTSAINENLGNHSLGLKSVKRSDHQPGSHLRTEKCVCFIAMVTPYCDSFFIRDILAKWFCSKIGRIQGT